jgi:hypothetical protein
MYSVTSINDLIRELRIIFILYTREFSIYHTSCLKVIFQLLNMHTFSNK